MSFVHLHLHSSHSFDGQISVSNRHSPAHRHSLVFSCKDRSKASLIPQDQLASESLWTKLKELGQSAVALTDHGTMSGVIDFYNACREHQIKPLIGCEVYVSPFPAPHSRASANSYFHLTLIAKNSQGYSNLCQLMSTVCPPDIDIIKNNYVSPEQCISPSHGVLARYSRGLICLTGCLSGPISQALLCGDRQLAKERLAFLKEIFRDDLFVELMNHGLPEQQRINPLLLQLAQEMNITPVATNDVHCLNAKDAKRTALSASSEPSTDSDTDEEERTYINVAEYLKSEEEMLEAFSFCPEAVRNTQLVAERVEDDVLFDIATRRNIPKYRSPQGLSSDAYLKELCRQGWQKRIGSRWNEAYQQRLDQELQLITDSGFSEHTNKAFSDSFLIVSDYTRWAKEQGFLLGPGMGTEGCSLVCYLLGITDIDPLLYSLPFERMCSSKRTDPPAMHIECNPSAAPIIAEYIYSKYGAKHAAFVAATSDPRDEQLILALAGDNIKDYAPCVTAPISLISSPSTWFGYDEATASKLGLFKVKLLGSRQLEALLIAQQRLKASAESEEANFSIDSIIQKPDDPQVYKMLCSDDSAGLLQPPYPGLKNSADIPSIEALLRQLQPNCLGDLAALCALYRPAAISGDLMSRFIAAKHQPPEAIAYLHPLLKPILEDTYGVLIYQEQLMFALRDIGGFSLDDADMARQALGRRRLEPISEVRRKFVAGAQQRGIDAAEALKIFEHLEESQEYLFNKSHALGWALTAYCTAYIKCHYPIVYRAAMLVANQPI